MNALIKAFILFAIIMSSSFIYWRSKNELFADGFLKSCIQKKVGDAGAQLDSTHKKQQYSIHGPGIFFIETSDRMVLPSLVTCSIESAARTYPDRPVYFLMKGLREDTTISLTSSYRAVSLLASLKNVHILPLRFEDLFQDTPLQSWHQKVNPAKQRYWTHHVSDACREVLLWKYGGIYMDTDVISIRQIPVEDFLAAESPTLCSSAVLGFRQHHPFLWECMEDYVKNYNGDIWIQQGPLLYTRVAAKFCEMPNFEKVGDAMCSSFSYLQPKRFFPISYDKWFHYFSVWDKNRDIFNNSYALHFWNYMNKEQRSVTAGSNTVAEYIFKKYCPATYDVFVKS
ncbi:alpha-1,4-N-acetylglucosaminyltransferase-like [Ambystoma mexicanum]|uniref:alpha-1,4-N-acetylglucosaminyltransferase-like n=1 Tax=Ambystoma mexicanum TaxID=8296 RepID=UPI0037E8B7D1